MEVQMKPRRAPSPDRIDLGGPRGFGAAPFSVDRARDVLSHLITQRPIGPDGARLAPTPPTDDRLLGHLREGVSNPLRSFLRWRSEVGDVIRLRLAGMTGHLITHPDEIRAVLQERHREFIKPIQGRRNMARLLGNGLLVSEGNFWLRQRRIAQPAFHRKRIQKLGARMVLAAEELADEWEAKAGEPFDVARDMMRLTLRIVQETLLGVPPSADADRIGHAITYLIEEVNRSFSRFLAPPDSWPTPGNRRFARERAVLDRTVQSMIDDRRKGAPTEDLLSMLLSVRDEDTGESMDNQQLRDEVMTMFLAGHETTANALSWTFYLLGRHPIVARRLRRELDEVLGGRVPTTEDYPKLVYTKMVFQEAMRLYPPAWIVARTPREDVELRGYTIPGGSRLFLSPWVTHRHPELWADPEGFDPGRFAPEKTIDPFAYFPFGGGRRLCIGQGFAMMEGVLLLASLTRRLHLELVAGHPIEPEALITLRPRHGVLAVARVP
ncbi:MAG: cytochrome P450 [Myxococcota bacterium]